MNLTFYEALDRIPLGIAVTLEFVGPLSVAVLGSRRRRDLIWVALAATGLILLAPVPGSDLDALGCAFALFAGVCWGLYIPVTARVGRAVPGGAGIALAMVIATLVVTLPFGPGRRSWRSARRRTARDCVRRRDAELGDSILV